MENQKRTKERAGGTLAVRPKKWAGPVESSGKKKGVAYLPGRAS